jgi:hypothetical protein
MFENVSGDVLYFRLQFELWRVFYYETVFRTSTGNSLHVVVAVEEAYNTVPIDIHRTTPTYCVEMYQQECFTMKHFLNVHAAITFAVSAKGDMSVR